MSEISHCNKCNERMLAADHRDESVEQDGMCISCRKLLEQCREEEATQSFCEGLMNPVAEWFTEIINKSGFEFVRRMPEDINDNCIYLKYQHAVGIVMHCDSTKHSIALSRLNRFSTTQPDWRVEIYCPTPVPVILATIKTAVEHESK